MNGGEMMVVLIVAIVMVARVIHTRRGFGRFDERDGGQGRHDTVSDRTENRQLRDEVRALRDRIAVLERIATDGSVHLDREIEALRDRPSNSERL